MDLEKYRRAIHKKVCGHCIDLKEDDTCSLTGDDQCGVETHLPEIVRAVQSIKSERMSDYVAKLREIVCEHCKNQDPNGKCRLRSEADCGLDRYFEFIVEAIEEVDKRKKFKTP